MLPKDIKKQFPVLNQDYDGKKIIYFDNACTLLKPRPVIRAVNNYYQNLGVCSGDRSSHRLSWQVQDLVDAARENVRRFIGASSADEIVWTKNTTEGINLVAAGFPIKHGRDEVVITGLEHHSNLLPFYEQSKKRKYKLKIIPFTRDGTLDLNKFEKAITRKTALVALTYLSNVTGLVYPAQEIAKLAHQKGARILIDAAQYVATHRVNVSKEGYDFLVFSGHKIGGPTGIGVLYGQAKLLEAMPPYNVGGGTVRNVAIDGGRLSVEYLPAPGKFEAGIQHYAGIIGLSQAVDFMDNFAAHELEGHVRDICDYARIKLSQVAGVEPLFAYSDQYPVSLISFKFTSPDLSLHDFNIYLNEEISHYFIAVRCGHHCAQPLHQSLASPFSMRLSFFAYNNKAEVDIFIKALKKFLA